MALSKLQERLERSLFRALRLIAVAEGYLPDITNTGLYGSHPYTAANQLAWDNALIAIAAGPKGFAIEIFNHSQTKGVKVVPRIAIIPRRTLPGDIGGPMQPYTTNDPNNPASMVNVSLPLESSNFFYDIHLISNSAAQDRVLHGILKKAFGEKKYLPYYDDLSELFFIRQTSDFDLPDPSEGIKEQVYTYEIPDLFDVPEDSIPVALTKQINLELESATADSTIMPNGEVHGGTLLSDGGLEVKKDSITYQ